MIVDKLGSRVQLKQFHYRDTLLVKNTMPLLKIPYVEVLAVMARYSKFFDAAGMIRVPEELYLHYDKAYERSLETLRSFGFELELLSSKSYSMSILRNLPRRKVERVRDIALKHFVADKFRKPVLKEALLQGDLESIAKALTGKRLPYMYILFGGILSFVISLNYNYANLGRNKCSFIG